MTAHFSLRGLQISWKSCFSCMLTHRVHEHFNAHFWWLLQTIFEQYFYFVLICGSHINRAEQWINDKDKIFRAPKWKFIRALEESDTKLLSGFCQSLQRTRSTLLLLLLSFWKAVGHCLRLWHCYEQNKDIAMNKSSITFWISVNILLE